MKKSVIYLGVALLAFANVSVASNGNTVKNNVEFAAFGKTPLTVAVGKGDIEIVKKFIEYGADVNQKSEDDMTPLMIAARYNRVEIIKLLIANGARTYEKNEKGYTALKYAQLSNAAEAIAILKDMK
nr:ankyrin repeat domain-containing protein [uncultured Flavobacterium sp.]